jgi:hypothetical protein
MLVVNGFFESGVFIPERPLADIQGRQKAVLHIAYEDNKQERVMAWKKFSQIVKTSNEVLEGEPERLRFKTPEEMSAI